MHRELINVGRLAVAIGEDFDTLVSLREMGDYGGITMVDQDTAERAVAAASRVIAALEQLP